MSKQTLLKIFLLFLVSFSTSLFLQRYFQIGLEDIQNFVIGFGLWAPLAYAFILVLGLVIPFNPISDTVTVSIAALVFPPTVAIVMTFIAHSIALLINFSLARIWGDDLFRKLLTKEEAKKIDELGPKIHPGWIFGFRFLLPLNAIGFDFVSYAAGISRMDPKNFYIASIIPWTILSILFFTSSSLLRDINPGLIFLPIVLLVCVPVAYFSYKNHKSFGKSVKSFLKK